VLWQFLSNVAAPLVLVASAVALFFLNRDKMIAARLGAACAVAGAFVALMFVGAYRATSGREPRAGDADLRAVATRNIALSLGALGLGLTAVSRARRA
jgi:hypothetical protein